MKLNAKGLSNLVTFLRKSGNHVMAEKVENVDMAAIAAWEDEAFRNAFVHKGELISATVEVGTWSSGLHTYSFDLSEVVVLEVGL